MKCQTTNMKFLSRILSLSASNTRNKSILRLCSSSSSVTYIRQVNPFRLSRDQFVESLCTQLHEKEPEKYSFLKEDLNEVQKELKEHDANEEILELLSMLMSKENSPETAEKCLTLFESWVGRTKLNLAFYMFANRDVFHSVEFLSRIVKHLSSNVENLSSEEIVALWLCIHFSNRVWSREELYEHLDFTVFQMKLAKMIPLLSVAEISCILIGMKKVRSIALYHPELRFALYTMLSGLTKLYSSVSEEERAELDHLVCLTLPILEHDGHVRKDPVEKVNIFIHENFHGIL